MDPITATAYQYTVRYYPRWFTWVQSRINTLNDPSQGSVINRLAGPMGMGPEYKIVVAINDDTVYAQAFLDLSAGPMILTLPVYPHVYSILQLDVFGSVFATSLSSSPPAEGGSYGLCLDGQQGLLPEGVHPVVLPYPFTILILRIDRHAGTTDVTKEASIFRDKMLLRTVAQFEANTHGLQGGGTIVAPLFNYAPSVKMMADVGILEAPEAFLSTLQAAMADPTTQPLDDSDQRLISDFNNFFNNAKANPDAPAMAQIIAGARLAHAALINRWQSHRLSTNWVHFNNIGHWGNAYLDRAALTEYIQYGNDATAAYYANAFVDGSGLPLDGASFGYTLTFAPGTLPTCTRFWSLTAYTPGPIELVPNPQKKYLVASYTPGLTFDGESLTLYMSAEAPADVPGSNWLPVPNGPFSLLFRVYGPTGDAQNGEYVPPALVRVPRS